MFTVFTQELADENFNLFVVTETDPPRLALSTRPCFNEDRDSYFEMVGRIIGLALSREMYIPVQFALPLIKQILGIELVMEDLRELDSNLYQQLSSLPELNEAEIKDLALDFTVDDEAFGKRRKVCLLPRVFNSEKICVTKGLSLIHI